MSLKRRIERGGMAALREHDQAVNQSHHLDHLGRDEEDGATLLDQVDNELVDLGLRLDVDAAGRLIEHQDLGIGRQHSRKHDLLLVPAGKRRDGRSRVAERMRKFVVPPYQIDKGAGVNDAEPRVLIEDGIALALSAMDAPMMRPWPLRSSGTSATPSA